MKLIISGATGSLGGAMVRHFSDEGHEIIATGRWEDPPKALLKRATYLKWDIRESIELPAADALIHCAALSNDTAKLSDLIENNVKGAVNAVESSGHIKKFIHISSSSVYVHQQGKLLEKDASLSRTRQLSPYGISKLQSEIAIREIIGTRSCDILRPKVLYGIGDRKILPRILKFVKNGVLQVPGKMECSASITHYKNMARAIECCLESDRSDIHIYNVADESPTKLISFVRSLCEVVFGKQIREKQIPIWILHLLAMFGINGVSKLLVHSLTQDMVLDISAIQEELGYEEVTNFSAELDCLQKWLEQIGGFEGIADPLKSVSWDHT